MVVFCSLLSGCYSLNGISIPPSITTFYIDQFQSTVSNAPPDIAQRFSQDFRDLVLQSTSLNYDERLPHIEFSGAVTSFKVSSVAPQQNSDDSGNISFGSSLNRLTIAVNVEYVNNQDDEDTWKQSFSFFADFEEDEDLNVRQDELIDDIFEQILQEIFTKAFTNW